MNDQAISGVRKATLTRYESGDEGTFGILTIGDPAAPAFKCYTLELPSRENAVGKSCIPAGEYLFKWRTDSPKHGECYEEWDNPLTPEHEDVLGRSNVQIHAANLAGDVEKGYVSQLLGCIAPGMCVAKFPANVPPAGAKAQMGVTGSKDALRKMNAELKGALLMLKVCWIENGAKTLPIVGGY